MAGGGSSAIIDTFLQMMVEAQAGGMPLSQEQAMAMTLGMHRMSGAAAAVADKLSNRLSAADDYPMIGRDDGRNLVHEDRAAAESSAGEDDDFSDNDEPEALKAE